MPPDSACCASATAASGFQTDEEEMNGNPTGAGLVALAIQRAENPRGDCEIYHYNTDGTLDWATSKSTLFISSDLE